METDSAGNRDKPPAAGALQPSRQPAAPLDPFYGERVEQLAAQDIRRMLGCIAAGVVMVSKDEQIVYANSYVRQVFGQPPRTPLEVPVRAYESLLIQEDGRPLAYDDFPVIRCLRSGKQQGPTTLGMRVPGDRLRWMTLTAVPLLDPATGEPQNAIVTVVDSSHPKHVEDSLRASEDRYRRLVELAPDAIIVHRANTILYINDAGVKLYGGRSREDFLGRDVLDLVAPQYRHTARLRIEQARAGEQTPVAMQRHLRLDGRPAYVEVTGTRSVFEGQDCVQVICRDVTRRRRAERALRRAKAELEDRVRQRTQELSDKNRQLEQEQRFMKQALAVGESDRKLVAYEIHDTILQDVIGALMLLDATALPPGAGENATRIEQASQLLRKCIAEARRMISGLRPLILDEQGLGGAVDYLVNEFLDRGMNVQVRNGLGARRLAADLENSAFRIVQEALFNVERHSGVKAAEVALAEEAGLLRVEIRDRGIGFNPKRLPAGHFGLEAIQQRAKLAGGHATIASSPGAGTEVLVELPLRAPSEPPLAATFDDEPADSY